MIRQGYNPLMRSQQFLEELLMVNMPGLKINDIVPHNYAGLLNGFAVGNSLYFGRVDMPMTSGDMENSYSGGVVVPNSDLSASVNLLLAYAESVTGVPSVAYSWEGLFSNFWAAGITNPLVSFVGFKITYDDVPAPVSSPSPTFDSFSGALLTLGYWRVETATQAPGTHFAPLRNNVSVTHVSYNQANNVNIDSPAYAALHYLEDYLTLETCKVYPLSATGTKGPLVQVDIASEHIDHMGYSIFSATVSGGNQILNVTLNPDAGYGAENWRCVDPVTFATVVGSNVILSEDGGSFVASCPVAQGEYLLLADLTYTYGGNVATLEDVQFYSNY